MLETFCLPNDQNMLEMNLFGMRWRSNGDFVF